MTTQGCPYMLGPLSGHPPELVFVDVSIVILVKYPDKFYNSVHSLASSTRIYSLEGRDGKVLPVSLTLRVSFLEQSEHAWSVLDVANEVVFTNLEKFVVDFELIKISHLAIFIRNGPNNSKMFFSQFYSVFITHGNVLLDRNSSIPASVSLVKKFTQSYTILMKKYVRSWKTTFVLSSVSDILGNNGNHPWWQNST